MAQLNVEAGRRGGGWTKRAVMRTILFVLVAATGGPRLVAQEPHDPRQSMLRAAMRGILLGQASVPDTQARHQCLLLPADPPDVRLQGPHGDSLLTTRCEVVAYRRMGPEAPAGWITARYRWTSVFTVEDPVHARTTRDTVTEEEVVVLAVTQPDHVRAVWHKRFETGSYAIWWSVTPELASTPRGTILFSVRSCVNGTGGCSQDFLQRYPDGRWAPVRQVWLDKLPRGFAERIRHGVRIDPRALQGEAAFCAEREPNCWPSARLVVQLQLRGDSLVLLRHDIIPGQQQ